MFVTSILDLSSEMKRRCLLEWAARKKRFLHEYAFLTFHFQGHPRRECLLRLFTRSSFHIGDQGYHFGSRWVLSPRSEWSERVMPRECIKCICYSDRWRKVAQNNAGRNVTRWLRARVDLNEFKLKLLNGLVESFCLSLESR